MANYVGDAVCECGERMGVESSNMAYVSGEVARFHKDHGNRGHHVLTLEELVERIGVDKNGRLKR